jgi:GTPase SAR1 family protein
MIHIITGSSGSGKTSCIPYLKKEFPDRVIVDFDEIGVPENATKEWRQETTELWLQRYLAQKQDMCLLGQMVPGEVLACPSAIALGEIPFCLLDCRDQIRIQRLKSRGTIPTQDMLGWAAWLRIHQVDPQWHPSVITDNSWVQADFSRWESLTVWDSLATSTIIDTTDLSLPEVADVLAIWIRQYSI